MSNQEGLLIQFFNLSVIRNLIFEFKCQQDSTIFKYSPGKNNRKGLKHDNASADGRGRFSECKNESGKPIEDRLYTCDVMHHINMAVPMASRKFAFQTVFSTKITSVYF